MWKRIENYIKDHREEIDRDEPGPMVWNNIEKALHPKAKTKKLSLWAYMRAAAMILVAAGAGYWWMLFQPDFPILPSQTGSILDGVHLIDQSIPEMEEVEAYYTMEFSDRMAQIKEYDLSEFPPAEAYMEDLAQVNECITEIKKDLEKEGFHDQLVEAMVKNFEQKIAILEQLLTQLEKSKKAKSNPPI